MDEGTNVNAESTARHRARRGEGERLRGEILAAAQALLIETADTSGVSIRAIADRVGVTPPSIYRHFADKDTLMMAVCAQVFAQLDEAMEKAAAGSNDPFDELCRKGHAYVAFGMAHPEHYRLVFMIKHTLTRPRTLDPSDLPGTEAFQHLQDTVRRAFEVRAPGVEVPEEFATTCALWTALHGITSARISLPDFPWPPLDDQLALFVAPWRGMLEPHQVAATKPRSTTAKPKR
jgi:AcrR family transcriptional regulator